MKYWLLKSEPNVWSIDQQKKKVDLNLISEDDSPTAKVANKYSKSLEKDFPIM